MNTSGTRRGGAAAGVSTKSNLWIWLAAVTAVGAVLRVVGLNRGLWLDEIYFLLNSVRHSLAEIVTVFPSDNQHPLYSVLARVSVVVFGESPWSLRLPAVVFGTASIPLLYLLGTSVTTRLEALLGATLLAVSYHHVWFSQNARGYTTLAFWTLLSTYWLVRAIQTRRRGFYVAYAVAAALGLYTHLTMAFVVASHVLICAGIALSDWREGLGSGAWKPPLQAFLLTGGLALLLYLPIAMQVQNFFLHRPSTMLGVSTVRWAAGEILRGLIVGLGTGIVLAAAALVVVCGAWSYLRQSRAVFAMFALPGILTPLGAVLVRGTMYPRFYFSLIGFAVLILVRGVAVISAWAAARWPRRPATSSARLARALTVVLASALVGASALSLVRNYRYPKQDFDGAMRFVDAAAQPGDVVVTVGATTYPFRQYYRKPWERADTVQQLREICRRGRTVWVIYTFPRYLEAEEPGVLDLLRKDFQVMRVFPGTVGDGDMTVDRFQPGAAGD